MASSASSFEPLPTAGIADEQALAGFLDRLEERWQEANAHLSQLLFRQYQTKRRPPGLDAAEEEQAALTTQPAYREVVSRFLGRVSDPVLARRLELWDRVFRSARVAADPAIRELVNRISDALVDFRYQVQGEEMDLGAVRHVLRTEQDRERRRAAWRSFAPLSRSLAAPTRELFHRRNEAARREGFRDYVEMQLADQGLAPDQVKGILQELRTASEASYRRLLAEGAERHGLEQIQPWDLKFLLEGEGGLAVRHFPRSGILPRMEEWAGDHGLDLAGLGITVHFLDIPYNGLCMSVAPGDIRILANPSDGHNYYKTLFHELGHSLHSAFNRPGSHILRREPAVFSEGMAETLAYTVQDPAWLAHVGVTEAEVEQAGLQTRGPWYAYLRERSAHALFEYEAYANPDGDLDGLNAAIEAEMMGSEADGAPRWAAEPNAWYSRYPVYWQNYVLADVIASQLHHYLRQQFGGFWRHKEALEHVRRECWEPGGRVDWQEKLRRATGEGLSAAALAQDLNR